MSVFFRVFPWPWGRVVPWPWGRVSSVAVCAAVAGVAWVQAAPPATQAPAAAASRILVVPFELADVEPHHHWLGEASAILLVDGLRSRGVEVIGRTERVSAFEHLHLPLSASLSRATIIKVGQLVGAGEVVVGSLSVDGDDLVARAHAIRLEHGRVQPEVTERGPLGDLLAIFDRLSRRLSGSSSPAETPAPIPLGAFESYVKGLLAESAGTRATFLESAIRDYPAFDRARLALWSVRTDQADHEAALAVVRAVPAASPVSRRARFAAALSLLELRRFDESFEGLEALLDPKPSAPSNGPIYNNLGVVQLRRGPVPSTGTAAYYLTRAAEAQPDQDYLFNLGYAYVLERNYQGALYWLREALRRDPTDADAHYALATALQATGSLVEASRERDLARQLSARYEELESAERTSMPEGLERLAPELESGVPMGVERTLISSAQREQRELATFHLERGRRLFEREQDRDAMAELRRAVYLSPYEAEAHLLIGRIHLRAGRPAEAVEALKISIWSTDTADAHVALAEAYLKSGEPALARAEVDRALELDPESAAAKRLAHEILR
ncbi:MAG TPA: tetratricopeptide repeat protein [Vicinamibacterales bacterium]|nr:tetratricopeptide repeat protein [Vicinamibacterales bacterium]